MIKWILLILLASIPVFAQDADFVYSKGISAFRESEVNPSKLVPAVKLLTEAAVLYEKEGNEAKLSQVNSCLYWAKKKLSMADIEVLYATKEIKSSIEKATVIIPINQNKKMLDSAKEFAFTQKDDYLLIAIRYFEVADRFKDSEEGRLAMKLSLEAMQKVKIKNKEFPFCAVVEIKFNEGWSVYIDGREQEFTTPCSIELNKGPHGVILVKDGFIDINQDINIKTTEKVVIQPKQEPKIGRSDVLFFLGLQKKEKFKEILGKWTGSKEWTNVLEIFPNNSFKRHGANSIEGRWEYEDNKLHLIWIQFAEEVLRKVDKNTFICDRTGLILKR